MTLGENSVDNNTNYAKKEQNQEMDIQEELTSSNTTATSLNLANLLSQLLNNKTIEITIKIKD